MKTLKITNIKDIQKMLNQGFTHASAIINRSYDTYGNVLSRHRTYELAHKTGSEVGYIVDLKDQLIELKLGLENGKYYIAIH